MSITHPEVPDPEDEDPEEELNLHDYEFLEALASLDLTLSLTHSVSHTFENSSSCQEFGNLKILQKPSRS